MRKQLVIAGLAGATSIAMTAAAGAHEAWLLTPEEMIGLASAPKPAVFTNPLFAAPLAALLAGGVFAAISLEPRWLDLENRLFRPLAERAGEIGPAVVRLGLSVMLFTAALGLLPAAGVAAGTRPTLFVPDMQLKLFDPAWGLLVPVQLALAAMLLTGLGTRIAGLAVAALAVFGLHLFGETFLAYAGHFAVPGLYLAFAGGGKFRLRLPAALAARLPAATALDRLELTPTVYRGLMIVFGLNFAYLGITYKLMQPTLLIAILEHGGFPEFGVGYGLLAFVMTFVEISAGLALVAGVLVRPVGLFLISAFTLFAVTLGETPFFHSNLYAMAAVLVMAGAGARRAAEGRETVRRLGAPAAGAMVEQAA
ncbi:hypothetical protein [Jiella sonneratiae]|uniref:DoxX family protein n=1 Tax=Jiella sonneratiae TaxID=2816856 RepID=A0ABS3J6L5_9HYPH|nr:hypothetical protein [Jiella sonneratiae]MBO0905313.1 hypothetical protein [Jiella sonneratiae]